MKAQRLLATLEEFAASANATPGNGVTRFSWSPADRVGRAILEREFASLGLKYWTDGIGNVHGVFGNGPEAGRVILGSHLDSVRHGGTLDGIYGVAAALEVVRSFCDEGFRPARIVEVIAFAEEEGSNYGCTCLGSKALTGQVDVAELKTLRDAEGDCYSRLRAFGLDPDALPDQRIDPATVHAFLEAHIEQNAVLQKNACRLGVVTTISGMCLHRVALRGHSDHAASPMRGRRDPMAGFAEFARKLEELWEQGRLPEDFSFTVGELSCSPGVGIVIPESVIFTVDIRHVDVSVLKENWRCLEDMLREMAARRGLEVCVKHLSSSGGARMAGHIQDAFCRAARARGVEPLRLSSGPAHDAAAFGSCGVPTGMLFVPSIGGLSHCPQEATDPEDLALGAQVLEDVARHLAGRGGTVTAAPGSGA